MTDNHRRTSHRRTSHGMLFLVSGFAAGGVFGWVARGFTDGALPERVMSYDDHDRTTYPPDAEDDVPSAVTDAEVHGAAPNLDNEIDPEIGSRAARRGNQHHGTSVAERAWVGDPMRRSQ